MEVYVDDLVIKSHTETEMLRDIDETFRTLRKINMKLNPKKCTFGAVEGMFLGYTITPEGIKPCPDKTEAVLQLPSPRTIKEKCIKKSDFHWTPEAEQAFKQLKQHLSELPLLVAPKPKEELIIYLSASYGAVSAVLMTERGTVQTPVYFISRALQGPELNYTPMEKLVLSLVFATKRLRRKVTKIERHAGEHNITYRPRTSVKGQILADFLVEKPDENQPDTSTVETPPTEITLRATVFSYRLNNEAEYEALLAGLRITAQMGVRNIQRKRDKNGCTLIVEYLKDGTLPGDRKEASKLRIKDRQYELMEGILSKAAKLKPMVKGESDTLSVLSRYVKFLRGVQNQGTSGRRKQELDRGTSPCLWAHRTMIKSSHGDTPFSLTYGTEAVIPAEIGMPTYRTAKVDTVHNDEELRLNLDLLEEKRERAAICEAKSKMKMTKYYNARVRGVAFRPGDFVYRSNDASHAAAGGKLRPKWEGPYEVTETLGDGAYKLRTMDGADLPRTWNIANLKKCYL
ncbi:reverse transcriptase domain-containing protein [Tanacetum coccineum]